MCGFGTYLQVLHVILWSKDSCYGENWDILNHNNNSKDNNDNNALLTNATTDK